MYEIETYSRKRSKWQKPIVAIYAAIIPVVIGANFIYGRVADFVETVNSNAAEVHTLKLRLGDIQAQLDREKTEAKSTPPAVEIAPVSQVMPAPIPTQPSIPVVFRARKPHQEAQHESAMPRLPETQPKKINEGIPEAGKFTLISPDQTVVANTDKIKLLQDK